MPSGPAPLLVNPPIVEVLDHAQNSSAWSTFHRLRYRVQSTAGEWIEQEREFLDRGDAVALLPYCASSGTVLLTRQFRMPIYLRHPAESLLLEVCGGILDNADPAVTVRHEALDELGLELGSLQHVFDAYSTPGSICEKVHYFIAPYTASERRSAGGGNAHEGEAIDVLEMPLAEAVRLIRAGEILDARTVALVFFLAATGMPATL